MKFNLSLILFLLPFSVFASNQQLLLDASCKVNCLISVTEVENDQGTPTYKRQYEQTYIDFLGLTREQLEKKIQKSELDKVCKKVFSEKTISEDSDCLYFKH